MVSSIPDRNKVFISYSHKDAKYLDGLLPHLQYLEQNKSIDFWVDTKIKIGAEWQIEIKWALASAKVAILLISVDFLISPFIVENELPPLLFAAEAKGMAILPVILRPCTLPPSLSRLQAINSPSKPLSKMKGYEREELWDKVANATVVAMNFNTFVEKKVNKEELLYDDELNEAIREVHQVKFNPASVLSKQNKIGEK